LNFASFASFARVDTCMTYSFCIQKSPFL
jgi:hypothetical protein